MAVITGIGAVSSLGHGAARIWSAMAEGRDGLAPIRRFDASELGVEFAGMVPDRNTPSRATPGPVTCAELAIEAARQAWQHAALDDVPPHRIALVFGSSLGDSEVAIHRIAEAVGEALGIAGPRLAVTTACASSANAIGLARDLLDLGIADIAIAGGADALTPLVLAGFRALGVLAAGKCAPFSEPAGTTLAEGAGFLVLEREPGRVPALAAVLGYGLSADAFHDTGPDPSGAGVTRALRSALVDAHVAPDEVDYVNAHGTGTLANDPAEWRAICSVFGARSEVLPVSSSKSFLGHAQGAAGVLEIIATLVAMEHGAIPPTQRYTSARLHSPHDPVGSSTARPARCNVAVSNSSGFGGANCAVVVAREPRVRSAQRRAISIASTGVADRRDTPLPPGVDPRGLDPATRFLVAAAAGALSAANVTLRADDRDRAGLVVGQAIASPESDAALHRTIARDGYRGLSASLFSRQVVNASAGTCARVLGLRGAHSTLGAGAATGLLALAYAAELLATRTEIDRVIAAGVDELTDAGGEAAEGAACALLVPGVHEIELAGWSVAGPGRLDLAITDATTMARIESGECAVDRTESARGAGFAPMTAVARAIARIRAGEIDRVVIARSGGASCDCAVVLCRGRKHHAS
ncbi:MAG TPA: beta-ketoacyl-[acyl-carrier-protein] synthase family protein [Kofleriaceae bacterium]|nr:beta-ketoacyl-[acyl-carrier-protein] synthase family protein [Kofleriaceae bacterium]